MSAATLLGEAASRHDEAAWSRHAIELIQNDQRRSADTHLLKLYLPAFAGIDIYLKDESTHPTGSLKHRLARSLFLYGICNGRIRHDTPIVEASSGSTAISEAYFARMLGLPFHAVMSASTSQEKVQEIERQSGECHLVADGKGTLASRMKAEGARGALVTLICDSGERYGHTYYSDDWIAAQGFNLAPQEQALDAFLDGKAELG
jgi:cysteine synthase